MDPAATIIARLGGYAAVAQIAGKHISRVYRWTYPEDRGGTGGVIPQKSARRILAYARRNKIALPPEAFLDDPRPAINKARQ